MTIQCRYLPNPEGDPAEIQSLTEEDFPLTLGGPDADVDLGRDAAEHAVAYLGLSEGEIFIQANGAGTDASWNGKTLEGSEWVTDGDVLTVGKTRLDVELKDEELTLRRRQVAKAVPELRPPSLSPPPRRRASGEARRVEPIAFTPHPLVAGGPPSAEAPAANDARPVQPIQRRRRKLRPAVVLSFAALALLGIAAFYVFTARSVEIVVEPAADQLEVAGLPHLEVGGRHLLLPGKYTVSVEKAGYYPLNTELSVSGDARQSHAFKLERLPGQLELIVRDVHGGEVTEGEVIVDGEVVGSLPLGDLELAPGGHLIAVQAPRYEPFEAELEVAGGGKIETLTAELVPNWAPIAFSTQPAGATLRIDGEVVGKTPLTAEVGAGKRRYEIFLGGYKPRRGGLNVEANSPQTVPAIRLEPTDGLLAVRSEPEKATVQIDGRYRGETPLDLELAPGRSYQVKVSKSGYEPRSESVEIRSGQTAEMRLEMAALTGEVRINVLPSDAELIINGEPLSGEPSRTVKLQAVPHTVEVKKAGYVPFEQKVTPIPGVLKSIDVQLVSREEAREAAIVPTLETAESQPMKLIQPGRFVMGASRREPGRRANEGLREVELTRRFYVGVQEISNKQFRIFRKEHLSGQAGGQNLEIDHHPVVNVTWNDAVEYCNWLSAKEGLPSFYVRQGDTWVPAQPLNNGYRLPTEAEWAWVARFPNGEKAWKYPWGDRLPIAPKSGNYADSSASSILPGALGDYNDGFAATAPTDAFQPNNLGLHNLGGNVAEWVHDVYSIRPALGQALEKDPMGPAEGDLHVIRGSSWMHSTVTQLRLTFRDYGEKARPDVGFRIARYVDLDEGKGTP